MSCARLPPEIVVVWWLQEMIEEMCKHVEKPLVFPLSNPTSQAEITAENAYKYSKGKCIFAGGEHSDKQFVTLTPCTCTAARGRCCFALVFFWGGVIMVSLHTYDTVWQNLPSERVCHSFAPLSLANWSSFLSLGHSPELVAKDSASNPCSCTDCQTQSIKHFVDSSVHHTFQHLQHAGVAYLGAGTGKS
jgi:hypothetical protein